MTAEIEVSVIEKFFQHIWAFELLEPEHLRSLARMVTVRKLKQDRVIWLQGQPITHFTVVYDGQLKAVRGSVNGNEKLVSCLTSGYHFGLAEMITGAASAVALIAEKPSTVLNINHKPLQDLMLSNGTICYRFMQTMARAIFSLTRELERTSFENVHTRLARLLLKGRTDPLSPQKFGKNVTHEQLAVQLGVSRETVSRVLSDFRRANIIATSYRNITVTNRDGLMQYIDDYDQW